MMIKFRLDEIMKERRLKYREVADGAGLALSVIYNIRKNKSTRIDLETLDRLSDFLSIEPGELITKVPNQN